MELINCSEPLRIGVKQFDEEHCHHLIGHLTIKVMDHLSFGTGIQTSRTCNCLPNRFSVTPHPPCP